MVKVSIFPVSSPVSASSAESEINVNEVIELAVWRGISMESPSWVPVLPRSVKLNAKLSLTIWSLSSDLTRRALTDFTKVVSSISKKPMTNKGVSPSVQISSLSQEDEKRIKNRIQITG